MTQIRFTMMLILVMTLRACVKFHSYTYNHPVIQFVSLYTSGTVIAI